MKHYPKTFEDLYPKTRGRLDRVTAVGCTADELAGKFRSFYKETYLKMFDDIVKHVWLEQQFKYRGKRRKRLSNGIPCDAAFGCFIREIVGISQKPFTTNFTFSVIASFLDEMFPHFLKEDPFVSPEKYKYPFEHVTIDFLCFVYACKDRMDMLRYADERKMNFVEFSNWAANHALSQTDKNGVPKYVMTEHTYMWKKIGRNKEALWPR